MNNEKNNLTLNTFLTKTGFCSRRTAQDLIKDGKVTVNHWPIKNPSYLIKENDTIRCEKKIIKPLFQELSYIVLNKPVGVVTTASDEKGRVTVVDYIDKVNGRLFPVGRLDITTSGALLMTNDGELATKLIHPSSEIEKVYQVTLDRPASDDHCKRIARGLFLTDGRATVDKIIQSQNKNKIKISLHSGKNRIVRRIFESLGYTVLKLERINFAGINKKGLEMGQWRNLTKKEIDHLKRITTKQKKEEAKVSLIN